MLSPPYNIKFYKIYNFEMPCPLPAVLVICSPSVNIEQWGGKG